MKKNINELRPPNIDKEYEDYLLKEIEDYFFTKGNKLNTALLEKIRCPACNSKKSKEYSVINHFKLVVCDKCALIYVNPRPKLESQLDFFSRSKAMDMYSRMVNKTRNYRQQLIFNPLVDFIFDKIGDKKNKLLEIGCGPGLFLDAMKKRKSKYILSGLDINPEATKICKKKGYDVHCGSIENYRRNDKVDVIVFWAVLDHFSDPLKVLKKCNNLIKKNGTVIIGNLNIEGFESIILGKNNTGVYAVPERQNFFGIQSIKYLLNRSGFKKVSTFTTGKLDVKYVKDFWEKNPDISRDSFLNKIIYGKEELQENFQKFLIQNNLSSHMTTIARKT